MLQHNAGGTGGVPWMTWKIVETSGTGELTGLRGGGQISIAWDGTHSYVPDYEFTPAACEAGPRQPARGRTARTPARSPRWCR